jgi:flagellar protein FliO/FliZ
LRANRPRPARAGGRHPLLAAALLAPPAFAQAPAVPGVAAESFVQGFLGLLVVVALILAAAWLLRRLNVAGAAAGSAGMKIVGGLSVGPRERILLLEVGDAWVVVGVTATQMRTLHTLPKGQLPAAAAGADPRPFAQLLRQFGQRGDAR